MNNNDKQLLIDAARAVGYPVPEPVGTYPWQGFEIDGTFYWLSDPEGRTRKTWNPLKNDSDAFRLMVDLDIDVNFNDYYVDTYCGKSGYGEEYSQYRSKQECVRRAIVLAAAELGRSRHDQA